MSKKTSKPTPKPKPKGARKASAKVVAKAATKAALKATSLQSGKAKYRPQLPKTPSGILGLDEITLGGLPKGRPTLVCGGAGCGKTVLGMVFLVNGALLYNEPGVFMSFQESEQELIRNVEAFGFDLKDLIRRKKLVIDSITIERSEIEEAGKYDLEGLFIRLGHAIDSIGAKRVVLDTIESLFSDLANPPLLRAEISRLFRWLKKKGVTAVITGEPGVDMLTRQGLEEYISDCVIKLDNRISDQICSRRLRVIKYRGSEHGTNEYPFLIDEGALTVLPITSAVLKHLVSNHRIPTGVQRLDAMLGGKGYYQGSSVLVSGTAGTGKSSLAAHFLDAACRRGERAIYFTFEEASEQIVRNMRSIGIDLEQWVRRGLLQFSAHRPTTYGLEKHLLMMQRSINDFDPSVVAVDPLNSFLMGDNQIDVKGMLMRLVNFMKMKGITSLFTSLTPGGGPIEQTDIRVSSLIDTWILLRDIEYGGERNRTLCILKSRGMAHSNQVREFLLTDKGVELRDVYVGPSGVLTGTARVNQEAAEKAMQLLREQELKRGRELLAGKRSIVEAQIAAMRAEFKVQELASLKVTDVQEAIETLAAEQRKLMAYARGMDLRALGSPKRLKKGKSK
ncbi:MAG: circadian clock protein KaiC [Chthoniobacterales bacterium]